MKNAFRNACAALMASAVLLAGTADAGGANKDQPKLTFIKGVVEVGTDGKLVKPKRGAAVAAGAVVKTGADSRAELTFPDGSVVRIGPGAELKIEGSTFDHKTKTVGVQAELLGGEAWAKVATLVGQDAKFQLKTQNAVAGVRGTVFRVNVDKDAATVVKVYNGSVAVAAPVAMAADPKGPVGPLDPNRKEIAPPFKQVTVEQFEVIVGQMMQVKVPAQGGVKAAAVPSTFTAADDESEAPAWVKWNQSRDAGKDAEKSD
jgi:hypothetical protein